MANVCETAQLQRILKKTAKQNMFCLYINSGVGLLSVKCLEHFMADACKTAQLQQIPKKQRKRICSVSTFIAAWVC